MYRLFYSKMRFSLVALFCLFLIFSVSVEAATIVGKGSSAKTSKGDLRIVFPLNEKTTFTSFRLENPARLVVDIPQAQLREKATSLPIKGGYVQGVRLGTQQGTDLRIVVDMSRAMPASTALVRGKGGYELVILVNQSATSSSIKPPIVLPGSDETLVSEQTDIQIAKTVAKKNVLIVIDPGHGGKDPGASGPKGTREKNVVLAIARQLKNKINRESGMRAVLTRDNDRFISLRERVLIARRQKADMFISIHADAGSRSADGASVYILSTSGASSEAARMLAEKENMSDMIGGVKISDKDDAIASMLLDISQDATIESSHVLGKFILNHVQKHARLHKKNVERAGFAVLKAPDIPSVLVETGFISNPNEERKLVTASHQAKLADDILQGIKAYYKTRPATELVYSTVKKSTSPSVPTSSKVATTKVKETVNTQVNSTKNPVRLTSPFENRVQPKPKVTQENKGQAPIRLISQDNKNSVSQPKNNAVSKKLTHRVTRGESLEEIAKRYKVNVRRLKEVNNLQLNQLRVPVGTSLLIP